MAFYSSPLIAWTNKGLYCEKGDFYIDPHRVVQTAVVTHAHSDHARRGSEHYICAAPGVSVLKSRLGQKIKVQGIPYGEKFKLGEVTVSLHSAGHMLGSAQVRVECDGEVWVASGDYKRDPDPSCDPFEVVPCDTFITEATFGTAKYCWDKDVSHGEEMATWWKDNAKRGKNSIIFGYSLGKAQRVLAELAPFFPEDGQDSVLIYHTLVEPTECYRREGKNLAKTRELNDAVASEKILGRLILAPPSILSEGWANALGEYETAFASGWMQSFTGYGGAQRRYDKGFVMSDHADWTDLNRTIEETGAKRIFVQHRNGTLIRHLRRKGLEAHPVETLMVENYQKLGGLELSLF